MPNYLDTLLQSIDDPELQAALSREVGHLREGRQFGIVFERHLPETVRLYSHPIRAGLIVQRKASDDTETWLVQKVRKGVATLTPAGDYPAGDDSKNDATIEAPIIELVVVREFGDPIYPGLKSVGRIERGGDKPFHTVINSENYHALETLLYAYEGKVDCIYIDPPYNTGARDWKYNNDYVDGNDGYRHSKWLSFIEKRLLIAKRLLNPECSVLIATIDEKEYLRLGMLLEQAFPNADIQMVSSVINPSGSSRSGRFSRTDEYVFFVMLGSVRVSPWTTDMLRDPKKGTENKVRWNGLIRNGEGSRRSRIPSMFWPIYLDEKTGRFHSVGNPPPANKDRKSVKPPKGTVAVWPVDGSGAELMWRLSPATFLDYLERGYVKFSQADPATGLRSPQYLQKGTIEKLESGDIEVLGRTAEGALDLRYRDGRKTVAPMTTWNRVSHSAAEHGSAVLKALVPGRNFPYPKSLYAVEDALRFFISDKPDALVIDFFGGSGTTTHAVMRLNRQDGGRRRTILVTNNEVGPDAEEALIAQGKTPGHPDWEALGIFEYITKPRVEAAVSGQTWAGSDVEGEYKFTDEFPMSEGFLENVEFLELTYEDRDRISLGRAFEAVAPLLWMKAGSRGPVISRLPKDEAWVLSKDAAYGVLFEAEQWGGFVDAVKARPDVRSVFVVTNSTSVFQQVAGELPDWVDVTMLYEDYLSTFEINTGSGE